MSKPTVYFYCYPQGPATRAGYNHEIVGLAEGLKELGVSFYSDINYWRLEPAAEKFLFNHVPDISPDDCDIVVLNNDKTSKSYESRLVKIDKATKSYESRQLIYSEETDSVSMG